MSDKTRELLADIAVGLLLAAAIVAIVVLGSSAEPTFIYQAF